MTNQKSALEKKKLQDLQIASTVNDTDITILENYDTTQKVTLEMLMLYIKTHEQINNYFAHQENIGVANGIVPLNENIKIDSDYINFGNTKNTVFEGLAGKTLGDNLELHSNDKKNPHQVTKAHLSLDKVDNKSSSEILDELSYDKIVDILGYVPGTESGDYGIATELTAGLIKSGGDINIDNTGVTSVKDNSHNHTVENISELQTLLNTLDKKTFEVISNTKPTNLKEGQYWLKEF